MKNDELYKIKEAYADAHEALCRAEGPSIHSAIAFCNCEVAVKFRAAKEALVARLADDLA